MLNGLHEHKRGLEKFEEKKYSFMFRLLHIYAIIDVVLAAAIL